MSSPILPEITAPRYINETWWHRARCATEGLDTEMWFPTRGDVMAEQIAKDICQACPVKVDCYLWAEATNQQHGIWAGAHALTIQRRKRVRKALGK